MDGHGEHGLVRGHGAELDVLDAARAAAGKGHAPLAALVRAHHQSHVAVHPPEVVAILGHDHRPAGPIVGPALGKRSDAGRAAIGAAFQPLTEGTADELVHAGNAERAAAMGAQHAEAREGRERRGVEPLLCDRIIGAGAREPDHGLELRQDGAERGGREPLLLVRIEGKIGKRPLAGAATTGEPRRGLAERTGAELVAHGSGARDRPCHLSDPAVLGKAEGLAQVHHRARHHRRVAADRAVERGFGINRAQPGRGLGQPAAAVSAAEPSEIAEHGAGGHARQLVAIAEQQQPRIGPHGVDQVAHQAQIDHRRLVHDHHVVLQRVVGVVAEGAPRPAGTEQPMQGRGLERAEPGAGLGIGPRPLGRGPDRLLHADGGLARGRRQRHALRLGPGPEPLRAQQREHALHGSGLARARAARDHGQRA